MTPKEKAKELVDRFSNYVDYTECDLLNERETMLKNAKQCALICIDEITYSNFNCLKPSECYQEDNFWNEVKQEIENL